MKPLLRAGMLFAFAAALLGAPSAVLAAANELSAASVSAASGSVMTLFTFRVHYTSTADNPATSVTVDVAGLTLPMALESGTPTDGTYAVSTMLPIGAWTPEFRASAERGPQPQLAGPPLRVVLALTPEPSAQSMPEPTAPLPSAMPDLVPLDAPTTAPLPKPVASAAPATVPAEMAPPQTAPRHGSSSRSGHSHGSAPASAGSKRQARTGHSVAAPASSAAAETADWPDEQASPASTHTGSPVPAAVGSLTRKDVPWSLLVLAVFGMTTLLISAAGWLLLGRRRTDQDEPLTAAAGAGLNRRKAGTMSTAMRGRAARRSRIEPDDDPIIAAMNIPRTGTTTSARPARPAPRFGAGQVNEGPGERPMPQSRRASSRQPREPRRPR